MNKLRCEIVRDLLPSYIDGLTSEVTNEAIDEHISECEPCADMLEGMKTPESHATSAPPQVDYLKKIRRSSLHTAILWSVAAAVIAIAALAALWVRFFVIGFEVDPSAIYWDTVNVSESKIHIEGVIFDNRLRVVDSQIKESDGVVDITLKAVPKLFDLGSSFSVDYVADSSICDVRFGDYYAVSQGCAISPAISKIYSAKHEYVGDMSANARLAKTLGIDGTFGSYTNVLHTKTEPYGWSIVPDMYIDTEYAAVAEEIMENNSYMLLALIENLDYVTWEYICNGEQVSYTVDNAAASETFGCNIKQFGQSAAALQQLDQQTAMRTAIPAENNDLEIVINNQTGCDIYGIRIDYCINGNIFSTTGMQNADGTPLERNEIVSFILTAMDIPDEATSIDLHNFSFIITVTDMNGTEYPVGECTYPATLGMRYVVNLGGDFDSFLYMY